MSQQFYIYFDLSLSFDDSSLVQKFFCRESVTDSLAALLRSPTPASKAIAAAAKFLTPSRLSQQLWAMEGGGDSEALRPAPSLTCRAVHAPARRKVFTPFEA